MRLLFITLAVAALSVGLIPGCSSSDHNHAEQSSPQSDYYTCPMHPSVRSDRPGACPVCGMALVKKSAQQEATSSELDDLQRVSLSPTQRVVANVTTVRVEKRAITKDLDLVGVVSVAEPNYRHISMRFPGRLEKLHVNHAGQVVRVGDPVADVYSPEAISAQQEFILALESADHATGTFAAGSESHAKQAEMKLLLWGFTPAQVEELHTTRKVRHVVTIYSFIAGTVLKKNVDEQHYAMTGEDIFDVVDLSTVWVFLDIYEKDLRYVKVGQSVTVISSAYPDEAFKGRLALIDPVINPETRTARVRAEFANPGNRLKPQTYVTATLREELGTSLVVPVSSVLFTGKRTLVWVEVDENVFEPREITVGVKTATHYQVLNGIHEGDVVVATGGYLIDSESNLQMPSGFDPHAGHGPTGQTSSPLGAATPSGDIYITVKGKYTPDLVRVKAGESVRLHFRRDEASRCTDEVVFEDFDIRRQLPAFQTTIIELKPTKAGRYKFVCGMDMVHGTLVVEP
jgi:Cu(I)/Ag(I) efflux system membrane fusion protein